MFYWQKWSVPLLQMLWWYNLYFKKKTKDKEEIAERICAGMPSHFDIDTEVTLEMHWV